jgi:hypothetical protein
MTEDQTLDRTGRRQAMKVEMAREEDRIKSGGERSSLSFKKTNKPE